MPHRPRNIKTNQEYRNAVARARGRALQRLADEYPVMYQTFLREERMKEGLGYIRQPKLRIHRTQHRPKGAD